MLHKRAKGWHQGLPRDVHVEVRSHQNGNMLRELFHGQIRFAFKGAIKIRGQVLQACAMVLAPRAGVAARSFGDPIKQGARKDPQHMGIREGAFRLGGPRMREAIQGRQGSINRLLIAITKVGRNKLSPDGADELSTLRCPRTPQGPKRHASKDGAANNNGLVGQMKGKDQDR